MRPVRACASSTSIPVMPGLALYDFGDMVRTTTSPAAEDEQDLSKVNLQFPLFEALVRGYLAAAGEFLTATEKKFLAFSGKLITFEVGIRFLADYLAGDTYFKSIARATTSTAAARNSNWWSRLSCRKKR